MDDGSRSGNVHRLRRVVEEHAPEWEGSFAIYKEGRSFLWIYVPKVEVLPDRLECTAIAVNRFGLPGINCESWTFSAGWPYFSAGPRYIHCPDGSWYVEFRDDWIGLIIEFVKHLPEDEPVSLRRSRIMSFYSELRNREWMDPDEIG